MRTLLIVHRGWILSRVLLQTGVERCAAYNRRDVRGMRLLRRCQHHPQTHVDGFSGVIFERTSDMSGASKTLSSAPYLDVCWRRHGRRQVVLLASHSDVCWQCYLRLSLATYSRQYVFLAPVLLVSRSLVNFVVRSAHLPKGESEGGFVT